MKVHFPFYYNNFACKAGDCRHSCCIGWGIAVDDATIKKYESNVYPEVMENICDGEILMREDGRCPFLTDDRLCRLIMDHGETSICEICREHPRFYHRIGDRLEMGIGASCEEACRLILSSDYRDFDSREISEHPIDTDFDSLCHRERIYDILANRHTSFAERILAIENEYKIDPSLIHCAEIDEALSDLELLDEGHRSLICGDRRIEGGGLDVYLERFFAYLVFRHVSLSENISNLSARLGFCILLAGILGGCVHEEMSFEEICEKVRIISEEIEYSEDNTADLISEIEFFLF